MRSWRSWSYTSYSEVDVHDHIRVLLQCVETIPARCEPQTPSVRFRFPSRRHEQTLLLETKSRRVCGRCVHVTVAVCMSLRKNDSLTCTREWVGKRRLNNFPLKYLVVTANAAWSSSCSTETLPSVCHSIRSHQAGARCSCKTEWNVLVLRCIGLWCYAIVFLSVTKRKLSRQRLGAFECPYD